MKKIFFILLLFSFSAQAGLVLEKKKTVVLQSDLISGEPVEVMDCKPSKHIGSKTIFLCNKAIFKPKALNKPKIKAKK